MHRDPRDRPAWAVALAGRLLGQHYAVEGLWHAPDPRLFSYRSTVVIIAVGTAGFAAVALVALAWAVHRGVELPLGPRLRRGLG
ncbi:hypothetical protein [Streptomyces sp. NPDC057686]|uniref:hypothetical protein n=1 Tax=Streptomyces sp. NPDC057686 TaxID=3346212 RepID=UPI00368C164E